MPKPDVITKTLADADAMANIVAKAVAPLLQVLVDRVKALEDRTISNGITRALHELGERVAALEQQRDAGERPS